MSFAQLVMGTQSGQSLRSTHQVDKRRSALRVLLIDDHPIVRRALADLLASSIPAHGLSIKKIVECGTLKEALAHIAGSERFDLVITDLLLPDVEGADAVARLAPLLPGTPLIVVSGNGRMSVIRDAIHSGAAGYIIKNSALGVMGAAVRAVLDGNIYVPSSADRGEARSAAAVASAALTPRQAQIAALAAEGASNKEIAREVMISEDTVKYHLRQIYAQLGVPKRAMLRTLLSASAKAAAEQI